MLYRDCPGTHEHMLLEGYIPGIGHGTKLAENCPPKLAAKLAEAFVSQVNHWEDVRAAEILEEACSRCDGVDEGKGMSRCQKKRELRKQVGSRPFEYVQRLRKNLGHVSNSIGCRMLEEVQATENVMTAAQSYVCPTCYARKVRADLGGPCHMVLSSIQVKSHLMMLERSHRSSRSDFERKYHRRKPTQTPSCSVPSIVAIEDHDGVRALWLCHGTSLIRCGEQQVRPLVEEAGFIQPADVKAALKDLEDVKARSTTQFLDVFQAEIEPALEDNMEDEDPPENLTDYEPSIADSDNERQLREQALPGVVQMVLPMPLQNAAAERDRTPRHAQHGPQDEPARRMSIAP
eukprot:s1907_g11.t1